MPAAVRNDVARVHVTPDGASPPAEPRVSSSCELTECSNSGMLPSGTLPAGSGADAALRLLSTDAEAARALAPLARRRVLLLLRPADAFCRFEDASADAAFRAAAAKALRADVWFCAAAARGDAAPNAPRRNCTVGFAAPMPMPRGVDCAVAARTPRDWRAAFPGDKLLGANKLV